jgi:hypothetical protein
MGKKGRKMTSLTKVVKERGRGTASSTISSFGSENACDARKASTQPDEW